MGRFDGQVALITGGGVACFLVSADAAMMTGTVTVVDGGALAVDLPTLAFAD